VNWPVATDPLIADCDSDGLIDSIDPDPWDPMKNSMPLSWHASEFVQGLLGGDVISSDPRHGDEAFETGQFISQFACVGSFRDLIAGVHNGEDSHELFMLALGSIPVGGAELKGLEFIDKAGTEALKAKRLATGLKEGVFTDEIGAIKKVYASEVVDKLTTQADIAAVSTIVKKNGNVGQTIEVARRSDDSSVLWLEQGMTKTEANAFGKTATGWKHIEEDHIKDLAYTDISKNEFAAAFDPTGTNYRDTQSIQNLIIDCAKNGKPDPKNPIVYYKKVTSDKAIMVIIGSNGYIRSAYPIKISRVPVLL
jgi:hypothetical protein